jgi:hypothetical protein
VADDTDLDRTAVFYGVNHRHYFLDRPGLA